MNTQLKAVLSLASLGVCLIATAAQAATVRVKCEVRDGRAKVSVDGKGLAAGNYSGYVMSGENTAQTGFAAALAGEAEFDFNSQANDIAAGATAIASNFIVGGQVNAKIIDTAGRTVISDTAVCRSR